MNRGALPYVVKSMQPGDIKQVLEIERASFPRPWSASAYRYELRYNEIAHYYVARPRYWAPKAGNNAQHAGGGVLARVGRWLSRSESVRAPVVGYGGFWLMAGEAHISTIAVRPGWRGRGLGELLLATMIQRAIELAADVVTLEVRRSNLAAQSLYTKYGFSVVGVRKSYYSDNREDALIMTTAPVMSVTYQQSFKQLYTMLHDRLSRIEPG